MLIMPQLNLIRLYRFLFLDLSLHIILSNFCKSDELTMYHHFASSSFRMWFMIAYIFIAFVVLWKCVSTDRKMNFSCNKSILTTTNTN